MTIEFLDAKKRSDELRGPKVMVVGETAIGKTSLLKTLSSELLATTLLVDLEAGDLPVAELELASIRPRAWPELRDLAVAVGGPNPARATGAYSQAHYEAVVADPAFASLARFNIIFVDSYTELTRQCRAWCEQQPESFNAYGKKDLRSVYGLVARELIAWTQELQHVRARTVFLVAILEKRTDDYGVSSWQVQLEGQRAGRELPAILDEILVMAWIKAKDGKRFRALICQPDNPWGYHLVKDRSGRLSPIEEPHLGKLLAKLVTRQGTGET
jgi:hypothetical protein